MFVAAEEGLAATRIVQKMRADLPERQAECWAKEQEQHYIHKQRRALHPAEEQLQAFSAYTGPGNAPAAITELPTEDAS